MTVQSAAARMLPLLTLQICNGTMTVEHARMLVIVKAQCQRQHGKLAHRKKALQTARWQIDKELAEIEQILCP